jgi:hypothetical protein
MKKLLVGLAAAVAVAAPIATTGAASAAGAPVTTTSDPIWVSATSETPVDLPALNSQFQSMTINVSGTAKWYQGADSPNCWLTYGADGHSFDTGYQQTSASPALLLEGAQVGSVIYQVDNGAWHAVDGSQITAPHDGVAHHVRVIVNDRPGSYGDNSGGYSVTVTRTKG